MHCWPFDLEGYSRVDTFAALVWMRRVTVVDAKYYGATGKGSMPGWPDIVKQLYYEMALKTVVKSGETVSNCFAFPAGNDTGRPFSSAGVFNSGLDPVEKFPTIECRYINTHSVMKAYCVGGTLIRCANDNLKKSIGCNGDHSVLSI